MSKEKYNELSRPFETKDEATTQLTAFLDEVELLREKYRVAELVIVGGSWFDDEGQMKLFPFRFSAGNRTVTFRLVEGLLAVEAIDLASAVSAKVVNDEEPSEEDQR